MHPKRIKATIPRQLTSIQVVDGDISTALRLWKKMLKENKTIEECYQRKFYEKPSRNKRNQLNTAIYMQQKSDK